MRYSRGDVVRRRRETVEDSAKRPAAQVGRQPTVEVARHAVALRLVKNAAVRDFVESAGDVSCKKPDTATPSERLYPFVIQSY